MKKKILIIICLFFGIKNFAQSIKVADKYYEQFSYPKAAKIYEAIYEKGGKTKYVVSRIADSYYKNADTEKSAFWYGRLVLLFKEDVSDDELFKYAQSLRSNGNFKKSDSLLAFINKEKLDLDAISEETKFLLDETDNKQNRISIRNLTLNTEYSDFGGFMYNSDIYFTSATPKGDKKEKLYKWNNQPFLNIYKASSYIAPLEENPKDSIFELLDKRILPPSINTQYHESNAIFTKDGRTMYFTRVNSKDGRKTKKDKKNTINLKLFKSKFVKGEWTEAEELPFNSDEYSVGHPALSIDEKTLYFISDMPGGIGSTDIYQVSIDENGGYSEPQNLGLVINTKEKEMFPFVGKDSTLYFSSNGHIGMGLLDIFQSKINKDGTFSKPKNVGSPFNSNRDDFSFYVDDTGRKGFFSSNRKGGKGDDDIYSYIIYKAPEVCTQIITGIVRDKKTKKIIPMATIKLIDTNGEILREALSDEKGVYKFVDVECKEKKYAVRGTKLDHKPDSKEAITTKEKGKEVKVDLELTSLIVGDQIVINPIYFDYGKSKIREDAQYELENVVTVMKNHPDMVIKIESHTDSRGRASYNRKLSDSRAKSTRSYLISREINPQRIASAIGYGESRLLNHCNDKNSKKCSEEEHQLNRRSYFYIVKGGKNVGINNKKPDVVDKSFKVRQRLIRKKTASRDKLLMLLNNFKRSKAKQKKDNKCRKETECF